MIWTENHDLTFAERMLKSAREGKEKKDTYKELSKEFGCTIKECRERWEKGLEKRYRTAMQLAEKFHTQTIIRNKPIEFPVLEKADVAIEREVSMQQKPKRKYTKRAKMNKEVNLDDVIHYLQNIQDTQQELVELKEVKEQNKKLKERIEKMEIEYNQMKEDYKVVMSIIQRANHLINVG